MKFAATLVAAAIASTAVALNAKPAHAANYGQLFAFCLQQSGGQMNFCHSWTRCIIRNGTYMDAVCTTSARTYVTTGYEIF